MWWVFLTIFCTVGRWVAEIASWAMSNLWVTEQAAAFARLQKQNGVLLLAFDICSSALLVNAWNSPSGEIELQFFITVNFSPSSEIILKQCLGLCKRWIWDWREGNGPLWIHCRQNTRRDNITTKNASLCVCPHLRQWRQYIYIQLSSTDHLTEKCTFGNIKYIFGSN